MTADELGTCDLCGQQMIRTPDDCWHPHDVARACPPEPPSGEAFDPDAWADFHAQGLRPGRPGRQHFIPAGPKRIQRQRTKGWRMPDNAVYVGRPTIFGNPFRVVRSSCCRTVDVIDDNGVTYVIDHQKAHKDGWEDVAFPGAWKWARAEAVRLYEGDLTEWFGGRISHDPELRAAIDTLGGRDLACWCPLDQPCHADVLLDIANRRRE